VTVTGPVDGSVRLGGQTVTLDSTVGRNVTVAAQTFSLGGGASVAGDLGLLAQTATLDGSVTKTVYGMLQNLTINSKVGSVDARIGSSLTTGSGAAVAGDLNYAAPQPYNVDKSKVAGTVHYSEWQPQSRQTPATPHQAANVVAGWFGWVLYWLVAALVTGLVLVWLAPRLVKRVNREMLTRPGQSLLAGLLVLLIGPIVGFLIMVTVIGIPVALLLGALWLLALLTSGLFAGIAVGQWINTRLGWRQNSLFAAAVVGIIVTVIVFNIPFLGWLLALVATWWAVGGLVLSARVGQAQ
jgi:hypothetical protein